MKDIKIKLKKNNIDEKELKSFWIRHCSKLREIERSRNAGISYVDEITGIKYYSCVLENKVFVKPSSLLNANFQGNPDIFVFCIDDRSLKCIEIREGNIIIERFNLEANNFMIEIYDKEATNYLVRKINLDLNGIENLKKYINEEGLLPDKNIDVFYVKHGNHDDNFVIQTYKKGELLSMEKLPSNYFTPFGSLLVGKLDIDDLLSDLNKGKVKKL